MPVWIFFQGACQCSQRIWRLVEKEMARSENEPGIAPGHLNLKMTTQVVPSAQGAASSTTCVAAFVFRWFPPCLFSHPPFIACFWCSAVWLSVQCQCENMPHWLISTQVLLERPWSLLGNLAGPLGQRIIWRKVGWSHPPLTSLAGRAQVDKAGTDWTNSSIPRWSIPRWSWWSISCSVLEMLSMRRQF